MNIFRKTILSLLISVLAFAIFTLAAFTGLFDLVETHFYNPQVLRGLNREVAEDAEVIGGFLAGLQDHFTAVLKGDAVKRSFLPNQAEDDIRERGRIFGTLLNSLPGLRSVRFVDAGGSRIHFSTLAEDVLHQDESSLTYRNYQDYPDVLPYNTVESPKDAAPRIIFDGPGEQLIFSYPFSDTLDVYRGSALFTFSVRAAAERLVQEGQIKVSEDLAVVSSPGGFLLGLPGMGKENLKDQAAAIWREGILDLSGLDGEDVEPLALISTKYGGGNSEQSSGSESRPDVGVIFVGRLVQESIFTFPPLMRLILLEAFFLTVFLFVFLLFNLRQDNVTMIRRRLKQIQNSLFRQYYEQKEAVDWKRWIRELEQRRGEVRAQIKRDLPRRGKKSPAQAEIDVLIDRSWDEMITALGGRSVVEVDEEKLRALILDILRQPGSLSIGSAVEGSPASAEGGSPVQTVDEPEELEELDSLEEPAELVEVEPEALEELGAEEALIGLEESEDGETADEDDSPGGIVVTPETFMIEPEAAELEPLEEAAEPPPMSYEDLQTAASKIEFGSGGEAAGEAGPDPEVFSPFESLSFESPSFSGDIDTEISDPGADRKKKRSVDGAGDDTGLTEITGDGGLPFIYRPFIFRGTGKPLFLQLLDNEPEGPIREQDGIHMINRDILDPDLESSARLDPKLLRLVESIIVTGKS
jgi:hypothetical protein